MMSLMRGLTVLMKVPANSTQLLLALALSLALSGVPPFRQQLPVGVAEHRVIAQ